MKNQILEISVAILLIFTLDSCGGVVGNIEKYEFQFSGDSVKLALNNVYLKYPYLIKRDTILYGKNDGKDYFFLVKKGQDSIVFLCNVATYEGHADPDLSLTSAAFWGQMMELAPEMGFWEKRRFRLIFEEEVLPKIKAELK